MGRISESVSLEGTPRLLGADVAAAVRLRMELRSCVYCITVPTSSDVATSREITSKIRTGRLNMYDMVD